MASFRRPLPSLMYSIIAQPLNQSIFPPPVPAAAVGDNFGPYQANIIPDSTCYGHAMRACMPEGNWQLPLALLNTMRREGVMRTAFNYNVAMQVRGAGLLD